MTSRLKAIKFVSVGMVLILLLLSLKFELYSTKLSLIYLAMIFLALSVAVHTTMTSLKRNKKRSYVKGVLIVLCSIVAIVLLNSSMYHNQKFYSLSNDYGYNLVVREWNNQFGTCGVVYEVKNPLLLKKTDVFYSTERDYSPIASNQYAIELDNQTNTLVFKFKSSIDGSDYTGAYIDMT